MPNLPGPLLSAVTICLMEARPRGYAPLGLHADVPNIPQGLADGSSQLAQDDRWPPLICPYTPLQELHTNSSESSMSLVGMLVFKILTGNIKEFDGVL